MSLSRSNTKLVFQAYTVVVLIVLAFLLREISLFFTNSKFVYGLDDPYIHLALAQRILEGEYGINRGEAASPSSSIGYPFMLAVGLWTSWPEEIPFWLSLISMAGALWLIAGFIWDRFQEIGREPSIGFLLIAGFGLVISLNAPTFPMIGMEHPWHILATILVVKGAYELLTGHESKRAAWELSIGSILAPLMRYEGFPLGAIGISLLFFKRHYKIALLTMTILVGLIAPHMLMLCKAGLPLIPISVINKSNLVASTVQEKGSIYFIASIKARVNSLIENIICWQVDYALAQGLSLTGFVILLLGVIFAKARTRRYRFFWLLVAVVLFMHLIGGGYGVWGRYAAYTMAAMIMGVTSVILTVLGSYSLFAVEGGITIVLLALSILHYDYIIASPAASHNIYAQQYQMHRFATQYFPYPVAINDLGWVSYNNKNYVLDLASLGSPEVLRLRMRGAWNVQTMQSLVKRKGIVYAMIYRHWFPYLPSEWCHIATLTTPVVSAAGSEVHIYLIDPTYRKQIEEALDNWGKTLPLGARLYRFDCLPNSK